MGCSGFWDNFSMLSIPGNARVTPTFPMFSVSFPVVGLERGSWESLRVLKGRIWGCPCFSGLLSPGNIVVTLPTASVLGAFSLKSSGKGHVEAPSGFPVGSLLLSHPKKRGCGRSLHYLEDPFPPSSTRKGDFRILHVFEVPFLSQDLRTLCYR